MAIRRLSSIKTAVEESLGTQGDKVATYSTIYDLPLSGDLQVGDKAFVQSNALESNSLLYFWNGSGWYKLATVNQTPSFDSNGSSLASYSLATDGTPTVVTLLASDPEGLPIQWSYETSGLVSEATIVQGTGDSANKFTITPSTAESDEGEFIITFKASDGVNLTSSVSTFKLTFAKYYLISIPATNASYTTNATRGAIGARGQRSSSVDADGNIYTSWYAGNYLNTQSSNYAVTYIVTKHDIDGQFVTARTFYQNGNNYNGDYGFVFGNHLASDGYLYQIIWSKYNETGQGRDAFFLKRLNKSDLSIAKMNCINNGNAFWWSDDNLNAIFDSNDKAVFLGANTGNNSSSPFTFTLDRVDTSTMNTLETTQFDWDFYSGISAGSNIHENAPKILHEQPDGSYLVVGSGWNLQNTTSYDRQGGYIASVHDSSMSGQAQGMSVSIRNIATANRYENILGWTAASIGTSSAWSTYVPFAHVSSQSYGGILRFNSTSSTSFVASSNSSDYSPWVKLLDGSNNIYPSGICTDGTYLYVIGFGGSSEQYIIKIDPSNGSVVKCLKDNSGGPSLANGNIYFYDEKLWITCSGTFYSEGTAAVFILDTDLSVDIDGITNTPMNFVVNTNVTSASAGDTRTRVASASYGTNTGSSNLLENAFGSFPTTYGADPDYFDSYAVSTVPDRDAIELL